MAPSFFRALKPKKTMADYLELKLQEWNSIVSDETQCMRLSPEEEVRYLSQRNKNCKCVRSLIQRN